MIDIDYKVFGFLKKKSVWFAGQLPSIKGYHSISCSCCYSNFSNHYPFSKKDASTILIDLSLDKGKLFGNIRPRRRQKIRRAYKEEVQILKQNLNNDLLKEFIDLYRKFQVPKGSSLFGPWFMKALKEKIIVFKGIHDSQTLIMEFIIHDGCTACRWMRARNEIIKSPASTYIGGALVWEVIQYFKQKGYQTLDLGGLNHFKLSFGGDIIPSYEYSTILSPVAKLISKGNPIFSLLPRIILKTIF